MLHLRVVKISFSIMTKQQSFPGQNLNHFRKKTGILPVSKLIKIILRFDYVSGAEGRHKKSEGHPSLCRTVNLTGITLLSNFLPG
jgi:hypothetical protein